MIKYIDMGLEDVLVMVSTDVVWADFAKEVSGYGLLGTGGRFEPVSVLMRLSRPSA